MLKRWLRWLPLGMLLAAMVLGFAWLKSPRNFSEFVPVEQVVEIYLYTTSAQAGEHKLYEARPERREAESLLTLLEPGTLRFKTRTRSILWDAEETLFNLAFVCAQEDGRTEIVGLDLCSDGMAYFHHSWLGFLGYRLSGCDMDAVEAELLRLLSTGE